MKESVFIDEAGIHKGAAVCLVAGYCASPGQWDVFARKWRTVLGRYGGVPVFHSNEFFQRGRITNRKRNPYSGWSNAKANDFLGDLLGVIAGQRIDPVGCAVNVPDFLSYSYGERSALIGYMPGKPRRESRRHAPYHLAFRFMLSDAVKATGPDTRLHFIAADQKDYRQRAFDAWGHVKEFDESGMAHKLRGLKFEKPEDFPGLQAADLLAYHWFRVLERVHRGTRISQQDASRMNILTHRRDDMPMVDRRAIENLFRDVGATADVRGRLKEAKER